MHKILKSSILIIAASVFACQSAPDLRFNSPYFTGFIGSKIILNKALVFAPGKVAVYMQSGKIVDFKSLDFYQPSCKFEINTMQQQSRSIKPDQFKIVNIVRDRNYVANQARLFVSSEKVLFFDNPTEANYSTELYLYSETQSDVRVLTCSHWETSRDASHLTVNQIQNAMGSIITLVTHR